MRFCCLSECPTHLRLWDQLFQVTYWYHQNQPTEHIWTIRPCLVTCSDPRAQLGHVVSSCSFWRLVVSQIC